MPSVTTPPDQRIQVGITMANPHAAEQNAAFSAIYDPASPSYHHYLTAEQVAQQFGVDATTFAAVRDWATRDGLRLGSSTATHEDLLSRPVGAAR